MESINLEFPYFLICLQFQCNWLFAERILVIVNDKVIFRARFYLDTDLYGCGFNHLTYYKIISPINIIFYQPHSCIYLPISYLWQVLHHIQAFSSVLRYIPLSSSALGQVCIGQLQETPYWEHAELQLCRTLYFLSIAFSPYQALQKGKFRQFQTKLCICWSGFLKYLKDILKLAASVARSRRTVSVSIGSLRKGLCKISLDTMAKNKWFAISYNLFIYGSLLTIFKDTVLEFFFSNYLKVWPHLLTFSGYLVFTGFSLSL